MTKEMERCFEKKNMTGNNDEKKLIAIIEKDLKVIIIFFKVIM